MKQTEGTGRRYTAAGGQAITDQGQRNTHAMVNGSLRGLRPRVGKVKKALISVYDMNHCGQRAVFDLDQSYAEDKKTGEKTYFKLRNRVWELDADILPFRTAAGLAAGSQVGPGRLAERP